MCSTRLNCRIIVSIRRTAFSAQPATVWHEGLINSRKLMKGGCRLATKVESSPRVVGAETNLATIRRGFSRRVSSWDRTGGNRDYVTVRAGATVVLAEIAGAGTVRHMYVTAGCGNRLFYRTALLRMYWDGEETPSVEVPLGDFFGVAHAKPRFFSSALLSVNPGAPTFPGGGTLGLNSYFPMPFANGARIELTNVGEHDVVALWYHIDYEEVRRLPEDQGRFHAQWRRENPTQDARLDGINRTGDDNYVILEAEGEGHYVGCLLEIDNVAGGWYGEGDDMIFIDGEGWPPSIHGTGTEEIFGGGACPNREYAGLYSGFHLISNEDWSGKNGMYRFCVADPVRFTHSIRVTLEHGHANDLSNDYSGVAYWYQTEPHKAFPAIPARDGLLPRTPPGFDSVIARETRLMCRLIECVRTGQRLHSPAHTDQANALFRAVNVAVGAENVPEAIRLLDRLIQLAGLKD